MPRTIFIIFAVLAALVWIAPSLSAQTLDTIEYPEQIEGTWYIVTSDEAVMRAGNEEVFYAVTKFAKGTVLVAASNTDRYAAVCYPLALAPMVPIGEVEIGPDGYVTLVEESTLRAPSSLLGMSGSWKGLYSIPLLAGTELKIVDELKSTAGQVVGYRVSAPRPPVAASQPVGYVKMGDLRPASPSEVEAFLGKPISTSTPSDDRPSLIPEIEPETEAIEDAVDDVVDETLEAAADDTTHETVEEVVDTSLMDDMQIPENDPRDLSDEVESTPADESSEEDPVTINNAATIAPDKSARPASASILSVSALETLEATFNETRQLPREQLDSALEELLAEYTRAHDAAGDDESLARALGQRMEWINIRMETRDQRRAIDAAIRQSEAGQHAIDERIKQWQSGRSYILVGRMVPSAVYTGERLPLLYRVQGNDEFTGAPTTIGYVAPGADQDYRHMLGRVVGVIGAAEMDAALNLRIIRPTRIDVMPN